MSCDDNPRGQMIVPGESKHLGDFAMSSDGRRLKRARVMPGPLHELKSLLYRMYLEAGAPTLDAIASMVSRVADEQDLAGAAQRDTIRRCISSSDIPPHQADTIAIAVALARMAILDRENVVQRVADLWRRATEQPSEPLRVIGQWDPIRLGIHPATNALTKISFHDTELSTLTPYLSRVHDTEIQEKLSIARDNGNSTLAVWSVTHARGRLAQCTKPW